MIDSSWNFSREHDDRRSSRTRKGESMARQFGLKPRPNKAISKAARGQPANGGKTKKPLYSPASWRGHSGRRSVALLAPS
jgi:hypothetical protein